MKKVIDTKNAPGAIGPYSQGIIAEGMVYTSGQLPINPATGELVNDDVKKAAKQSLDNVKAILEAAGSSIDKVVKVTVLLKNIDDFVAVNEVYAEVFEGTVFPARSAFQVGKLPKDALIEIEAIATL